MSKKPISRKDRLIWFAGFFDGEGCVAVYLDVVAKHGKTLDMTLKVTNTCMFTMRDISEIFVENHIGFYWATNGNQNPALEICISGQGRILNLLKLIRPYMRTKASQADALLELITYRNTLGYKTPENGKSLLDNPKIVELVKEIKMLKTIRISPLACKRQANKVLGIPIDYTLNMLRHEDIVSPASDGQDN